MMQNNSRRHITSVLFLVFLLIFLFAGHIAHAQDWYNSAWLYRVKITVDHTKVAGNLTNFPFLVNIPSNGGLASYARSDGYDLLFTSSDEVTKLSHEIEKYVSATGELIAWVKIPSLSSTIDTVIYLYYGNPAAADQSNPSGVWDSNYKRV